MPFINESFAEAISVSGVVETALFGFLGYGLVINDGPDAVHLDVTAGEVTTDSFALASGESLALAHQTSGCSFLCASGDAAAVRVLAYQVVT